MKKNYYVIVNLILLIILMITVYVSFKPKDFGVVYENKFEVIEKYLKLIEKNMDEITNNNSWDELKEISSKQVNKETYNMLVEDIKICYLQEKELNGESSEVVNILEYKNKNKIQNKQLKEIFNNNCLKNFKRYTDTSFSDDKDINDKIKKQLTLILTMKETEYSNENFDDALNKKINIIYNVAYLSSWLKIEYDTYK